MSVIDEEDRASGWSEWLFGDGGSWAFPGEVEAISEGER